MKEEDKLVNDEFDYESKGELSDQLLTGKVSVDKGLNPVGSAYLKQVEVSSFPVSPEENVLYIVNGVKYRWLAEAVVDPGTNKVVYPAGWNRVFENPMLKTLDGPREVPVEENQSPKKRPQIFSTPVAFHDEVYIKGKKLQDYIDSEGGVTEAELQSAIAPLATKTEVSKKATIWVTANDMDVIEDIPFDDVKVGDFIVSVNENAVYQVNAYSTEYGYVDISRTFINTDDNKVQTYTYEYTKADSVWSYTDLIVNEFSGGGSEEIIAYEGVSLLPTGIEMTSWSLHRCIKIGSILWLTVSGQITNTTSESISFMQLYSFTLPSSITSHIYRENGTTCDESNPSSGILYWSGIRGSSVGAYQLRCQTANIITIESNNNVNMAGGAQVNLQIRIPIFLDIGTVEGE